jgi:hypothetical protein
VPSENANETRRGSAANENARLTRIIRNLDKQYNRKANQLIELRTRVLALADRFSTGSDVGQWAIAEQIREAVSGETGHPDGNGQ